MLCFHFYLFLVLQELVFLPHGALCESAVYAVVILFTCLHQIGDKGRGGEAYNQTNHGWMNRRQSVSVCRTMACFIIFNILF